MDAQAYREICYQGAVLKTCRGLSKSCNAENEFVCKPLWARPEVSICFVALLAKDYGHCLRSAPGSYVLQAMLSIYRLIKRLLK